MGETNLNVDLLLSALSAILSDRSGMDVTVKKGETNNDICSIQEISRLAE
jgi:hypothetical protein